MDVQSRLTRLVRNVRMDLRFGGFLGGTKKTPFANLGMHDTGNSDYEVLACLFAPAVISRVDRSEVLVDIGCGRGRVINYWLDKFPGNKVVGIEFDPEVAAKAAARLRGFQNVSILSGDARKLIPEDGTLFYLYNSFNDVVLRDVLQALHATVDRSALRQIRLIYYNPVHIGVFQADERSEIAEIELPAKFHKAYLITIHRQQ